MALDNAENAVAGFTLSDDVGAFIGPSSVIAGVGVDRFITC